ncbi:MAG: Fe-S cluster assembly ATPase SufC [Patescibacteria group bacterium]|nr:Fe-S cluster assembly ATPase SufC [Patescibacteria group bacterium]
MSPIALSIENLRVRRSGQTIVKGVSLEIPPGKIVALMGPNGSGKSTVANAVFGHPGYQTSGKIRLDGRDLTKAPTHERSRAGLFMSLQQPPEIPGVSVSAFLRAAVNARREQPISVGDFQTILKNNLKIVGLPNDFAHRPLNEGFSGGEKKRAELLQLLTLQPKYVILDELDAGLDADALRAVTATIENLRRRKIGILLITHSPRFLKKLKPDRVHVLIEGRLAASGGPELASRVETKGYERFGV